MVALASFGSRDARNANHAKAVSYLKEQLGAIPGVILSAIPFGLLHYREFGNSWRHAVLIALAGTTFGWMRQVTGSTKASALMHASYNALIFIAVFTRF